MDQIPPAQLAKLAGEDQGPMTKAIVVTFVSLAGLFVCLRLFTRIVFQRRLWIDDYFVALSMVCIVAFVSSDLQSDWQRMTKRTGSDMLLVLFHMYGRMPNLS